MSKQRLETRGIKKEIKQKVIILMLAWSTIPPFLLFVLTIALMGPARPTIDALAFFLFASFALYFMPPYIGLWLIGIGIICVYYLYKWLRTSKGRTL